MSTVTETLNAIKARAEAAMPGPWDTDPYFPCIVTNGNGEASVAHAGQLLIPTLQGAEDAEFSAHSREDIKRLVAAVEFALGEAWCRASFMSPYCECSGCTVVKGILHILTTQPEDRSS